MTTTVQPRRCLFALTHSFPLLLHVSVCGFKNMCLCVCWQVDSDSWGNVEPDGVSKVPATRKGLTGLLGLLGMMGAVGVVPAGK